MAHPRDPVGLRLIVAYKFVRGSVALALALVLLAAGILDGGHLIRNLGIMVREHFTGTWSLRLANLLVRVSSRRHLAIGAAALTVDGLFTLFEGWALRREFPWSRWLVVIATASFLPFEIFEIIRGIHVGRVALFVVNVAVVIYLVRQRAGEPFRNGDRR